MFDKWAVVRDFDFDIDVPGPQSGRALDALLAALGRQVEPDDHRGCDQITW